MLHF